MKQECSIVSQRINKTQSEQLIKQLFVEIAVFVLFHDILICICIQNMSKISYFYIKYMQ